MNKLKKELKLISYFRDLKKKNYFTGWVRSEVIWLIVSTILIGIAAVIGWSTDDTVFTNLIMVFGTLTGMWCVIAVNKQRLSNYIFGLVNVLAFGFLYFRWSLYGMAALNILYFVPMQFQGIYAWLKNKKADEVDVVSVRWSTGKEVAIYITITVLGVAGMFFALTNFQNFMGNLGFVTLGGYFGMLLILDAIGVVGNVVAQVLMNRRMIDQWIFWFVIDVSQTIAFTVLVFLYKDNFAISMLVMYILWLANAYFGYKHWVRDYKSERK